MNKYISTRVTANEIYRKLLEKGYKDTVTRRKIKECCCPLIIETSASTDVMFDIVREIFGDIWENIDNIPTVSAESNFGDLARLTTEYGTVFFYVEE